MTAVWDAWRRCCVVVASDVRLGYCFCHFLGAYISDRGVLLKSGLVFALASRIQTGSF